MSIQPIDDSNKVKLLETNIGFIPEDWKISKLGDECEKPQYGLTASALQKNTNIKLLRITDIQNDNVNWSSVPYCECTDSDYPKYKLYKDDLLIARIGATTGKSYIVKDDVNSIFASYLIRVQTKESLLPSFLGHYVKSDYYWEQINSSKGGRLKQGINIPIIQNLLIPLPPLPEQKAIAHILSTVQRAKEATEQVIQATKELKKSLMKHLFTYGAVSLEEALNIKLKETEIGMVPEDWEVSRLGKISTIRYGLGQPPKLDSHGIPMIRATNIKRGRIVSDDLYFVDVSSLPRGRNSYLSTGDILIVRSGAYTGDIAIITPEWSNSIAGYDLIVSPTKNINSHFLSEYLQAEQVQIYFRSQRDRSAQPHLNSHQISETQVIVPPLEVQNKISILLSNHDKKVLAEEARFSALDQLFKALLNNLMTGKVRVKNFEVPEA